MRCAKQRVPCSVAATSGVPPTSARFAGAPVRSGCNVYCRTEAFRSVRVFFLADHREGESCSPRSVDGATETKIGGVSRGGPSPIQPAAVTPPRGTNAPGVPETDDR